MPQSRRIVPESGVRPGLNDDVAAIGDKLLVTYDAAAGTAGVELATTNLVRAAGVTMESIAPGRHGNVQREGKAVAIAGTGGVAIGDQITADGSGRGIATTTAGDTIHGEAVTAAALDEDFELELSARATVKA